MRTTHRKFSYRISGQAGRAIVYIVIAIVTFAAGLIVYSQFIDTNKSSDLDKLVHATSLHTSPRIFPAFKLIDHHGDKFTNDELKDTWNFIFFGFTHCPDVCPLTLNTLDQVISSITTKKSVRAQTVFISVDPRRDTPQHLEKYVQHFNDNTVGLTGNDEKLKLLTQSLGVVYTSPKSENEDNYLIDHSAHIFLVAPNGNLVAIFSTPHEPKTIVNDFNVLSNYYYSLQGS